MRKQIEAYKRFRIYAFKHGYRKPEINWLCNAASLAAHENKPITFPWINMSVLPFNYFNMNDKIGCNGNTQMELFK